MRAHLRSALARIGELLRPRATVAAERDEEFAFHLEMETAENLRRGMAPDEARRAAVLRFGGMQRFREETRDARGVVALDDMLRHWRVALRRLGRAPGFSAGVILTLGIGIGIAVGIGSIVHGVLLRDLPYDEPERLVRVGFVTEGDDTGGDLHSPAAYYHFASSARSFTALGAYAVNDGFNLTDGDTPARVTVAMVTPNTFEALRVRPVVGQLFLPGDSSWSSPRTPILISERLWQRRYDGDPSIIGRSIDINRGRRTVIGVLPRSFDFPSPDVDVYYPAAIAVNPAQLSSRAFTVVGRLRDGVTPAAAEAELEALLPALTDRFPAITREMLAQAGPRIVVESLRDATVAPVRAQLLLLGLLVVVVLLIATANVVTLFLLRGARTGVEVAIAISLGASRRALVQRHVIEGVTLGLASSLVAIPIAALALLTKFGFTTREIPRLHEVAFTMETAVLLLGCALVIGALVGLVALPRIGAAGVAARLRGSRATTGAGWRRTQDALVAFQVGVALMLLVAGGLLGRSFWNLRTADVGFEPRGATTFHLSLPWDGYRSYAAAAAFHAALTDRLTALPGVTAVGATLELPLTGHGAVTTELQLQAADGARRATVTAAGNVASAGYFTATGIPLLAGRAFRAGDMRGTPGVVLSERLATSLFGTADVVGRRVTRFRGGEPAGTFTVVGIVGDVHRGRIEDGHHPMMYFPLLRDSDGLPPDSIPVPYRAMDVHYAIRGPRLPEASVIQSIVRELERRAPATNVRTLDALVSDATARVRLTMLLIVTAGGAALLLGIVGVYGVVSYAATGRLREFGIRIALGAAPGRIGGMVLGDGLRLVAIGTVAGLIAAVATTRLLRALLYEVTPTSAS